MPIGFIKISETHGFGTALSIALPNVTAGNTLVVYSAGASHIGGNMINLNDTFNTIIHNVINIARGEDSNPTTITLGAGVINSSGLDIISATFNSIDDFHFLAAAEYSGVIIDTNGVVFDQSGFISGSASNADITLPIQNTSLIISIPFLYQPITSSGPSKGSLRMFDGGPNNIYGLAWLDNTIGETAFQYFPNVIASTVSLGLAGTIPTVPPQQLPAAIFKTPVVSQINKTQMDRLYPYRTLQVTPTNLKPLPFVCPNCKAPGSATIYRDVRDYAVSVGIPNVRSGGMPKGQSFDFIYCGACLRWYRKNDYKQVAAPAIVDVGINPKLNPLEDIGVGPPDEPEFLSAQENLVGDDVRISMQSNMFGFTDDGFERTGFVVQTIPTGSVEPS